MTSRATRVAQSDFGTLKKVALKHVRDAFIDQNSADTQWQALNYTARPDLGRAKIEYDRLATLLRGREIELEFMPHDPTLGLDSLYVRDAAVICERGVIARARSWKGLAEEQPAAYKNVDQVVEVVHQAQLAKKVARLRPIGVIKG